MFISKRSKRRQGVLTSLNTIRVRDAVVHINDINRYQGMFFVIERDTSVESLNILEKVDSVLTPMFPTIKGYQRVKDTIQPVRGSSSGALNRSYNSSEGWEVVVRGMSSWILGRP